MFKNTKEKPKIKAIRGKHNDLQEYVQTESKGQWADQHVHYGSPRSSIVREWGTKNIWIMAKNFPNLIKEMNLYTQKVQ